MSDHKPSPRPAFVRATRPDIFNDPKAAANAVEIGSLLERTDRVRKRVDEHKEAMRPKWTQREYEKLRRENGLKPSNGLPAPRPSWAGTSAQDNQDRALLAHAMANVALRSEESAVKRCVQVQQFENRARVELTRTPSRKR